MSNTKKQEETQYADTESSEDEAAMIARRKRDDRPMFYQDPRHGEPGRERVRKTRIKDREKSDADDSTLKIQISLDLEAEINLYARVHGDVTIGLL